MQSQGNRRGCEVTVGPLRLRPSTIAVLCALAGLSIILPLLGTVSADDAIGALLIIWISAVPALIHLQGLDDAPTPVVPFAGLYYIIFFGLPVFAAPLAYQLEGKVA